MGATIWMYAETWNGEEWVSLYPVRGDGLHELLAELEEGEASPDEMFARLSDMQIDMQPLYYGGFPRLFEALDGGLTQEQADEVHRHLAALIPAGDDVLAAAMKARIETGINPGEIPAAFPTALRELPEDASQGIQLMWLVGPFNQSNGAYYLASGSDLLAVDTDYVFAGSPDRWSADVERWEDARILLGQIGPDRVRVFFWYTT
jgi:hypothetical protein